MELDSLIPIRTRKRHAANDRAQRPLVERVLLAALACFMLVTLAGCGGSVTLNSGTGVFLVTPATAAFGNVAVGQTSTLQMTLVNKTLSAVQITALNISGTPFALASQASLPVTVASGASYIFAVEFAPTTVGNSTGTITVSTNVADTSATVVGLSGTATAASASPTPASLSCSPSTLTGAATTTCTVALSATASSGGTSVNLVSDNAAVTVPSTVTVAAGSTSTSFTATASAVASTTTTTLTATANGGSATAALTLNAAAAQLSLNSSAVAFGDVLLGSTSTQDLTLTSTGTTAVTVNSASLSGTGFLISSSSFPATLSPGQTATVTVEFAPTVAGSATGSLTIVSTSQTNPTNTVALTGTGVTAAVALAWNAPSSTSDTIASYRIYRAVSGSSSYALLGTVSASQTSSTDSAISSGTTYMYYVTAVDSSGAESVPSNTATITIP